MNEIKAFNSLEFGEVRTAVYNSEPVFCLADVCRVLDIANSGNVKNRLSEKGICTMDTLTSGGMQKMIFITESNLYKVIFQSRKPEAEKFSDWVTSEVLPSIRKHGMYAVDDLIANPELAIKAFTALKEEREKNRALQAENESKQKEIAALGKENDLLAERVLQWADRPLINALVRAYGHSLGGDYSTAWGDFKKELLYRHGINLNVRITHYLNNTGKKTKPRTLDMLDDSELQKALSTAAALCRENNVDISDIIDKKVS
nr:MAG TPA: hypothetical protein [Caudoviricetes sp.]